MKKKQINEVVSYKGLDSLAEVLESCMLKYSNYKAITDKYNNVFMTYGELREEMNNFASGLQSLGIKKGDKDFTTVNFFSEDGEEITIPLDENRTPSENVQSYYKKYNKLKKSEESAIEQLEKNHEELQYLYSVLTNIENCESYTEINSSFMSSISV